MIHDLKCVPPYFEDMKTGNKAFAFRKNDRNFQVDDQLLLREYVPGVGYTGRIELRNVRYILTSGFGLPEGYCIMGLNGEVL
jgi:hypothetical protein